MTNGNINIQRSPLPPGEAGVDRTISKMVELARGHYGAKNPKVRALALDVVRRRAAEKDYRGEAIALFNYVRDNIRYLRDPIDQETVSAPEETAFNSRAGDCDDQVTLLMALLGSIGIPSYPVVVGKTRGHYSHVYLRAVIPPAGEVIAMDPIMRGWPAGREAKLPAVKAYSHYAAGVPMNIDGLGDYKTGPSYLDTENSHAAELLKTQRTPSRPVIQGSQVDGLGSNEASVEAEGFDTYAGQPGSFTTAKQDQFGRNDLQSPPIIPAENLGPLGPMTSRGERLMSAELPVRRDQRVPVWGAGVPRGQLRKRNPQVTVPGMRQAHNRRAFAPLSRSPEQEAAELDGIGACLADLAYQCSGMGADVSKKQQDKARGVGVLTKIKEQLTRLFAARAQKYEQQAAAHGVSPGLRGRLRSLTAQARALAQKAASLAKTAESICTSLNVKPAPLSEEEVRVVHEIEAQETPVGKGAQKRKAEEKIAKTADVTKVAIEPGPRLHYKGTVNRVTDPNTRSITPAPAHTVSGLQETVGNPYIFIPGALLLGYMGYALFKGA
jgi:hypothetical protein